MRFKQARYDRQDRKIGEVWVLLETPNGRSLEKAIEQYEWIKHPDRDDSAAIDYWVAGRIEKLDCQFEVPR